MIDWNLALATAGRLSGRGPEVSSAEASEIVGSLRDAAVRAVAPVREFTGLMTSDATPTLVVDRTRWAEANLQTFRVLLEPMLEELTAKAGNGVGQAVGSRVAGLELGALLAFLSSKILGQFDPFSETPRLLLVAPNLVHVERTLEVDPDDFRLWVCLHEQTHHAQFTGVPWMRDHLRGLVTELTDATDLDPQAVGKLFSEGAPELVRILRGQSDKSIAELMQNEDQKRILDQVTGVMSLLEGHADVVMDGVGPELVPSVAEIRQRFEKRRRGTGPLDRLLRRLLGLETKMRQYRDGAAFVRAVTEKVGEDGFAAVWAEPANLPSREEILDPTLWVDRVHA